MNGTRSTVLLQRTCCPGVLDADSILYVFITTFHIDPLTLDLKPQGHIGTC
jgi:hypothetical protein